MRETVCLRETLKYVYFLIVNQDQYNIPSRTQRFSVGSLPGSHSNPSIIMTWMYILQIKITG